MRKLDRIDGDCGIPPRSNPSALTLGLLTAANRRLNGEPRGAALLVFALKPGFNKYGRPDGGDGAHACRKPILSAQRSAIGPLKVLSQFQFIEVKSKHQPIQAHEA